MNDQLEANCAQPDAVEFTAGTLLRQARETANLPVDALAAAIKVPVKKLQALESDRFDLLPDLVFARALASTVCRNLRVDAAPILQRLPATRQPVLAVKSDKLNTPFKDVNEMRPHGWAHSSRRAIYASVCLGIAAVALVLMPTPQDGLNSLHAAASNLGLMDETATASPPFPPDAPFAPADKTPSDAAASAAVVLAPELSLKTGSSAPVTPSLAPRQDADAAALAPSLLLATPEASSATAAAFPESDLLVFTASSPSWVEVSDANGRVVLRRLLNPGEAAAASGALPLTAVVGRADATTVQVRGKPLALASVTKNNVARFEVK